MRRTPYYDKTAQTCYEGLMFHARLNIFQIYMACAYLKGTARDNPFLQHGISANQSKHIYIFQVKFIAYNEWLWMNETCI